MSFVRRVRSGFGSPAEAFAALICGDCYDDGEGDICVLVAEMID